MACRLSAEGKRTALVDLDIANVYFRSRELHDLLGSMGIEVFGSMFKYEITAELPALSPEIRTPLEDEHCYTVVDVGGDDSGAKILNQFTKYFQPGNHEMLGVINANRPGTDSIEGAVRHMRDIESATGLRVTGLVNNTHMLNLTAIADVVKGAIFCNDLSEKMNIPLVFNCYPEKLLKLADMSAGLPQDAGELFPMKLFMRPSWLDR